MKKAAKLSAILLVTFLLTSLFYACKKDNSSPDNTVPDGQQNVSLYLTDDPAFFDNVFIDIRSVKVWIDTCSVNTEDNDEDHHHGNGNDNDGWRDDSCKVWETLNITPGIYDLLTLRNGTDTLLAAGDIPKGKIKFIKMELGPGNSLVKDGITYPLNLMPGLPTYILVKLKGDEWDEYLPGRSQLWLDFDIARSVLRIRNNEFFLKPFIKIFTVKATGSIQGKVLPREAFPVISIFNSVDTAYALPNPGGEFKVRGLKEGTYNVFVNASNGYADTTISGVTISRHEQVKLGKIELHN